MSQPVRAVLFDIDGTILTTGGQGRLAMSAAIEHVLGLPDPLADFHLDGMTDRSIVRRAADARRPHRSAEHEIDAVLERYLELLGLALPACPEYVVLPGVADLARGLSNRGLAVGLGTGNVERGARLKLERSGLNPVFRFGGYGDDAEDRAQLVAAGVERAKALCGGTLASNEVWVIGDTPKDIAAAQAVGARVLAVATGRYSVAELQQHAPDLAVPDLTDAAVQTLFG